MEAQKHAHTPAPWRTDPEVEHQAVIGPDGFMIADCAIFSTREDGSTNERCTANAHLIAAAPDLLAEIKRDLSYVREMKMALKAMGWTDTVQFTFTEMREKSLVAAIAKAIGESAS